MSETQGTNPEAQNTTSKQPETVQELFDRISQDKRVDLKELGDLLSRYDEAKTEISKETSKDLKNLIIEMLSKGLNIKSQSDQENAKKLLELAGVDTSKINFLEIKDIGSITLEKDGTISVYGKVEKNETHEWQEGTIHEIQNQNQESGSIASKIGTIDKDGKYNSSFINVGIDDTSNNTDIPNVEEKKDQVVEVQTEKEETSVEAQTKKAEPVLVEQEEIF